MVVCNGTVKVNSARQRAQKSEQRQKAHRTVNSDYPVHHRTVRWPRSQKLQRSNPNGWVTWLAHRTVRCAIRQQPSPTAILVVGAINTPNHPPFKASKFSAFTPHTRAIEFIQDTFLLYESRFETRVLRMSKSSLFSQPLDLQSRTRKHHDDAMFPEISTSSSGLLAPVDLSAGSPAGATSLIPLLSPLAPPCQTAPRRKGRPRFPRPSPAGV
jgi:hypothetical protein